jgi:imidazolonepropionase-like amidohydrolase
MRWTTRAADRNIAPNSADRDAREERNMLSYRICRRAVVALGCMALLASMPTPSARAQAILFEAARVIPGDGGPAIENAAILVEGGLITRIGRQGEVAAPPGTKRIALSGKTVMPAIINAHGHPGFQRGLTYSVANYTRETIMDDLNRELYYGVSTVMSQGIEIGDVMHQIRADQAAGRAGGAQLLFAGRGIGAPNAGPGAAAVANIAYEVTTEEEARAAAREQAARKVDAIKIWVDDRGGRAPRLPIALSRAVIEEAHQRGFRVAAHVYYHDDAVALVEAGINSFAHSIRDREVSDALLAAMLKNNVYLMPNLGAAERGIHTSIPAWFDEPALMGLMRDTVAPEVIERIRKAFSGRDQATVERSRKTYGILERSLAKLVAAGVRIILGSDTGLEDHIFGYAEQKELEMMANAGMTPAQVIVAATSRSAEYLGLNDRGSLLPGRRADLLVLDANPLDDIRNTRRIAGLYLAGIEVDRATIKTSLMAGARN